jgi:hypothetical protein
MEYPEFPNGFKIRQGSVCDDGSYRTLDADFLISHALKNEAGIRIGKLFDRQPSQGARYWNERLRLNPARLSLLTATVLSLLSFLCP